MHGVKSLTSATKLQGCCCVASQPHTSGAKTRPLPQYRKQHWASAPLCNMCTKPHTCSPTYHPEAHLQEELLAADHLCDHAGQSLSWPAAAGCLTRLIIILARHHIILRVPVLPHLLAAAAGTHGNDSVELCCDPRAHTGMLCVGWSRSLATLCAGGHNLTNRLASRDLNLYPLIIIQASTHRRQRWAVFSTAQHTTYAD